MRIATRMPRGFRLLIAAQFLSALADNALLVVTIALLVDRGLAPWLTPLLKLGFTAGYVVLAPFIGTLADAIPKARLMLLTNGVKLAGACALLAGVHPLAGYALVGLGAAAYAPAKYGLVTETVPSSLLVVANGWIEVSVVCAVLLGMALGGYLVSPHWLHAAASVSGLPGTPDIGRFAPSLSILVAIYLTSGGLNLYLPESGARYRAAPASLRGMVTDFARGHRTLWADRAGGLSLAVTTLFWGVGATLQFIVLRWAGESLHLNLSQAAYLQGCVAIGVVAGAGMAGRVVPLSQAWRVLPLGMVLGLAMPLMLCIDAVVPAVLLLIATGLIGGFLVVPMNALLQHRGCQLLSAGQSIAVQGFNENASVLLMLGIYAASVGMDVPLAPLVATFGLAVASGMAALWWRQRRTALSADML